MYTNEKPTTKAAHKMIDLGSNLLLPI